MIEIDAFQKRCETLLNRELEENGLKLFDREVVFSRDETFIEAKVADFKFWIYDDGADIQGENIDSRFEKYDFNSEAELIPNFVSKVVHFAKKRQKQQNPSLRPPRPLR